MDARYRDVGPNHAVATQDDTRVGDAVAAQGDAFTQQSAKLSQPACNPLAVDPKVNFTAVVAKVAEFGTCAKVDVLSENGIADVIEMGRFGARQEDAVFDFGSVTHDRIGTNPRIFSNIGPAADDGPRTDVAWADEVGPRLDGRRGIDDDPLSADKETLVVKINRPGEDAHLRLQTGRPVRVEQGPDWAPDRQGRQTSVLGAVKRWKKSGRCCHALPVHGHAMKLCGMKVVFAQAAAW